MPVVVGAARPEDHDAERLVVRVLLADVHAGSLRALTYARSLEVEDMRAVSFAFDDEEARSASEWTEPASGCPST